MPTATSSPESNDHVTKAALHDQAPASPRPLQTPSLLPSSPQPPPAPSLLHSERVLVPRAYKAAITDHFRPERIPRPYVSVTTTIGSIVTARSNYTERRYLHSTLKCTSSRSVHHTDAHDCEVQTEIAATGEDECGAV